MSPEPSAHAGSSPIMTKLSYEGDNLFARPVTRSDVEGQSVTCLIWGADLAEWDRGRQARHTLREHATAAFTATAVHPALRHLVIAYRCAPQLRTRLRNAAEGEARRLHAWLELKRARDIDVIMIDVTGLDNDHLADQRFEELATKRAGVAAYAAIAWQDMQHQSIQAAGAQDIV